MQTRFVVNNTCCYIFEVSTCTRSVQVDKKNLFHEVKVENISGTFVEIICHPFGI